MHNAIGYLSVSSSNKFYNHLEKTIYSKKFHPFNHEIMNGIRWTKMNSLTWKSMLPPTEENWTKFNDGRFYLFYQSWLHRFHYGPNVSKLTSCGRICWVYDFLDAWWKKWVDAIHWNFVRLGDQFFSVHKRWKFKFTTFLSWS